MAALTAGRALVTALAPAAGAGLVSALLLLAFRASVRLLFPFLTSTGSTCPAK